MKRRHALSIAVAAVLGALAIAALPALAGAKDDHGNHRGHDHSGERHHHHGAGNRHDNAGRISAFDASSGLLTISRFGGGTITGTVTSSTEIKCEGADDRFDNRATFSRDHGGSSGSSGSGDDNGGRGEEEPGDDHGEGLEPGDDNGGQGEEEPGDDHGVRGDNSGPGSANSGPGRGDENDEGRVCTTADLTVGTVVHDFDREPVSGVSTFDEIELAHVG